MLQNKILLKTLLLVVLSASAVVSIFDPNYTEKTKSYRLDPYIARELQRTHHNHQGIPSYRSESNPRLSTFGRYQESSSSSNDNVEQQERHANHDRKDYANNLDENYGGCPSGYTGLLSYPYDCRRFVNCWKGRAFIQTCGPGTVFNGDTLECDNPNKVVCKGLNAKLFEQQPSNNRLGKLQQHPDGDEEVVSCPQGHTGLLPHPNDCSKFLNCASGTMHIQTCGPHTMFNPRMKVCDFATKVDCTGRGVGVGGDGSSVNASPSQSPPSWGGNRGGKKFEITTTENQPTQPHIKGWHHNHNHDHSHNHHHHGFDHAFGHGPHHDYPSGSSRGGSFTHHNHNCTNRAHNHHNHHISTQIPTVHTPLINRNRWASMNRTRPAAPTRKTSTVPIHSWTPIPSQQPTGWRPIQQEPIPSQPNWSNRGNSEPPITTPNPSSYPIPEERIPSQSSWSNWGSSGQPITTTPPSNYPNSYYGSTPIPGTDTTIYYAQPVDDNEPSEEVFNNVVGADISEITLPVNRRNFSRGVIIPNTDRSESSDPSLDAINIPNMNLMPPYPTSTSDDRQFQIPNQDPVFSAPDPIQPTQHNPSRPDSRDSVFLTSGSYQPPLNNPRPDSTPQESYPSKPSDESMDAINIPNMNLMPPYLSPPSSDDKQSEIPDQFQPPPFPQLPPRPSQNAPTPENRPDFNKDSIYKINVRHNIPYPETTPKWEEPYPDYSSLYPSFTSPDNKPSPNPESRDSVAQSQPASGQPSWLKPQPPLPSYSPNPADSVIISSTPSPNGNPWLRFDESNLFGGMLPPLPPGSEDPSSSDPFLTTTLPSQSTTPLTGLKTNVRVFQIYPPLGVQNATTKIHPNPFYSPSYSGVAHSRNTSWPSIKTSPPSRNTSPSPKFWTTTPSASDDSYEPDIIFSHDGGVVVASHQMTPTTTQRHGLLPPSYNREFYKPTTPMSVQRAAPLETETNDQTAQMPISEAIKLLLRPYINRSGTVTDDMVSKAESHIMNLSHSLDPTSSSTTSSSSVAPDSMHKDVEIVFAGEQNSLSPSYAPPPPIHSQVQPTPSSKYHERHDRHFHQMHPNLLNPFGNELGAGAGTGAGTDDDGSTTPNVDNLKESDLCEFDCGNGQCVKTFETCDGISNCENRKDEEQCGHLGYEVRLSNEGYGRVEVKILGQWGYVCDDKFGIQDANVVCRELGFPLGASEAHGNSYYPPADGGEVSFVMDEVDCSGNETSLKDCRFMGWGVSDCGPDEVAGVQCKTPVMTCPNDYWLCSTSKECIPPAFVCDNVPDCTDKSDESIAVCNSTVEFRLKGGNVKHEGRLEVLYRGVWGTICDDDFGKTEAQVACNSLGYYGPAAIVKNAFGPGSGPIWLDQLSCYGNETTLDTCNHWSWGEHNCNHTEDVSLKCTPGSAPRSTNIKTKNPSSSAEDLQTAESDDIGMDLYPMERSSKFAHTRKVCGHFNANLTDEFPRELERVVKGNIAKRGHHPWQATIRTKGRGGISSHWCGAVLISKKHLLTAAHCLVGYPKGAYFIRLGDHYANIAESSEIDSFIENWYIHEKFREGTHMNNDIAVIVMKNPVRFNDYIQPICLPQEGTEYKEGRRCTISGWGSIQSGVSTPSNNLRVAEIPVISDDVCKLPHVYGSSVTEGMFCAGFLEEGVDACEGDSGGPFVCSDSDAETLYGIISWGQQCGHANKPGVYVRIEKYLDWIYEKIRFSMQPAD